MTFSESLVSLITNNQYHPWKIYRSAPFYQKQKLDRYSCSDQDQVVQSLRSLIKTDSKTKDNSFRVVFSQTALRCAGPGPFKNVQLFTIISGRKRLTCSLTGWAVQRNRAVGGTGRKSRRRPLFSPPLASHSLPLRGVAKHTQHISPPHLLSITIISLFDFYRLAL